MSNVTIVVSEHATKPLIHINDLKTVETAVHKLLCMNSLPEPQQRELANDIIYHWVEDTGDNGRHCVNPLVHVLVSERLTALFASMMEDPFMCHVMPAESGPRSMDWILVLHFDAYQRTQDIAFTESRKLLCAGPGIDKFIEERVEIQKDSIRPNECYAITRDLERAPLDAPKWKTATVCFDNQTIRVWQANALQKYATPTPSNVAPGGVDYDHVVDQTREAYDRIQAIGGDERLFRIMPQTPDELCMSVARDTGVDLLETMRVAKEYNVIVFFDQTGALKYVADIKGNLISQDVGVGAHLADLSNKAGKRTSGDGINVVSANDRQRHRIEVAALMETVEKCRPAGAGFKSVSTVWQGLSVDLHYPEYCSAIADRMGTSLTSRADAEGIVLMTHRSDVGSLILMTDSQGVEISPSEHLGNEIAKAFGGVVGRPVRS